jgi:uncharacterized metal-binding protein
MKEKRKKVIVLACSGIGKVYGALARETAYELVEKVRPEVTKLTCLPLLVIGDPEARQMVTDNPVITIDGCPKSCAYKNVEFQGARVARAYQAINFYKAHKDLKPEGVAELNELGQKLAEVSAVELAQVVDELMAGEED